MLEYSNPITYNFLTADHGIDVYRTRKFWTNQMQVIRKNDKSIIRISEHISSDTDIEEITGAVSHEINSGSGHIVISFINVSHPYSAVMSMINRSHSLTSSKGVAFSVVAFKRELIDVLIETRCNRLFGIFRSEQEMETVHLIQQS